MSTYTVTALGGERLDRIARKIYGTEKNGTVEGLLTANPGLAALGTIIAPGTVIRTPAKLAVKPATTYQLAWE
ncbi:MAG: tail protein X [Rhizobiaceae bacterium]